MLFGKNFFSTVTLPSQQGLQNYPSGAAQQKTTDVKREVARLWPFSAPCVANSNTVSDDQQAHSHKASSHQQLHPPHLQVSP
jgi:hypothetical protein